MASWNQANGQPSSNGRPDFNGASLPYSTPKWNAAALLNPRGAFQQITAQPKDERKDDNLNHNDLSQLTFHFDSPSGSPMPMYMTPPNQMHQSSPYFSGNSSPNVYSNPFNNENGEQQRGAGMGHMLERMHNVQDRDMLPQKRRKLCEDEREAMQKAEFNGGGKGGVLGQYIKEKQDEGKKGTVSSGAAVDLSGVDDQDVIVVGDTEDKEVCYGRIEGAEINAFKVPTPKPGSQSISSGYWPQCKIILRRRVGDKTTVIHAVDSTRSAIGCVDISTAIGICPLLDSKLGIRTSCRILTRSKKAGDLPPGADVSTRYGLDLNIYGPRKYAMQIGRHLSQKQLWLRTPLFVEAGIGLLNPHAILKPPRPARAAGFSGQRSQGPVRTVEEIRNDIIGMFDSLERSENIPEMEPDSRITTELLRHQKQGLHFMINKEKERVFGADEKGNSSLWRLNIGNNGQRSYYNVITGQEERKNPPQVLGGILADMMGLGKTLSILSLVVSTLDQSEEWAKMQPCVEEEPREKAQPKGSKAAAVPKIEKVPLARNSKTTLLVSPLSTIANWEEQIKQHIKPGSLKYYVYHGPGRIKDIQKLSEFDLVITTYGSVASEFNYRNRNKPGKQLPLEEINWFRIVLDEAHMIREQSTQQSKAICRLSAQRRWAVTGTPVQNRLEDLGALMTFLRIKPFDEKGGFAQYIMAPFKMCDPEILPKLRLLVDSITLRRLKDRIDLPSRHDHLVKLEFNNDERKLYEVFAKNASDRVKVIVGQREKSLGGKSYVHILQSILRLRLICAHGKDLLNEDDLKVMNGLSKDSAIDIDDEDDDRAGLSARQAYDMFNLMKETNADVCLICNRKIGPCDVVETDEAKDDVIGHMTPCYHILCNGCIDKYSSTLEDAAQGSQNTECPICKQQIKLSYFALRQGGIEEEDGSAAQQNHGKRGKQVGCYDGPHTKTKALIHDLLLSKEESEASPFEPPIKSVVFSGWTAHLDLIQIALEQNGITYTRLDGKMSRTARGAALDRFRDDPAIHVMLVSITAGGLGLNLTTANRVYVMEPQYNPAAEAQAVDRVHRLGQKREVTTVRYIMSDSFEEKMLELQEKKMKLASLSMDSNGKQSMDKAEAARKRLEDLRSLFK
ncbi:SNF2 family DNA-dependent ATPase [Phlyctema vagabunda]|uniref:SNF2 family DNA-dependent ATPase n=1 Tax=Phlyctema vagabunda TaxID=108571 RepID=A0ABR4P4M9_9HELO